MRVGVLALSLLLASLPVGAGAQDVGPGRPLTVEEVVRLGLERNARIRGADADLAAARAGRREAEAARLPAVRSAASYTRLGGDIPSADFTLPGLDTTFTLLPIERDRYQLEVVQQPLFTGGRLGAAVRAAAREADAAALLAEQERADVALEVRQAYWALHAAAGALAALDGAVQRVESLLGEVRSRFGAGAALRADVLAAQTRRSEVLLERVEARNAARLARLELNRLTGLPLTAEYALATGVERDVTADPGPGELPALMAEARRSRPQLRALAEQVDALRAQVAVARGGSLPDVAFVSRYVYARPNPYAFTDQDSFRGTWEAGLSLQWPVWEGGAQSARVALVRARLEAAEARLEDARRQVEVDVARRQLEAQRATEALAVAAENVEQAAEALRVTEQQFAEGVVLSSQLFEAELAYRQAQARDARAGADYMVARAALLHALGEW